MSRPPSLLQSLLPFAAIVGSIVSLTIGAAFAKRLFPLVGAEGVTTVRLSLAALLLIAIWRPWRWALARRDWPRLALYGAVLGIMNLQFYMAIRTLPLGIAIAIELSGPLTIAVFSSRRPSDFAWIAVAILGLALLLPWRGHNHVDPVGAAFALGAAVCWALYIVFGKRVGHLHPGQSVTLGMCAGAMVVAPIGLAHAGRGLFAPEVLGWGLVIAVLSSALPYSLEMIALRRLPKQVFGTALSLEPVIGALAGFLLMGERLTGLQGLAMAAIIVASAGSALTARPASPAGLEDVAV